MRTPQLLSLGCCVGVVVALWPKLVGGVLFAYHPTLMVLAYLGLMSKGILDAYSLRRLLGEQRVWALQLHGFVQSGAVAAAALGFYAIYENKNRMGKPHFATLHGQFGLAVMVASVGAMLGGVASFRKYGIITKFPPAWQGRIKRAHRLVSVLVWLAALVEMQLVMPHPVVLEGSICRLWQSAVALTAVSILYLLYFSDGPAKAQPAAAKEEKQG